MSNQQTAVEPVAQEEAKQVPVQRTQAELAHVMLQRRAKMLAASTMIPKQYQNNVADCAVAVEMADRTGMSGMAVLQNLDVIHGKPSWSAKFIIGVINQSGRFTHLKYHFDGEGDQFGCIAHAKYLDDGGVVKSPKVTLAMDKAEGWMTKSGSKWKTMPELMMSYRAASFFGRLHCADLLLGMGHSTEEEQDMEKVEIEMELPSED